MRSNTQDTNSKSAAKNMIMVIKRMKRSITGGTSNSAGKAVNFLTLGFTPSQWTASVMICAMLLSSVFALPVRAALIINDSRISSNSGGTNANKFPPVNEPLPVWKEMWMDLNAAAGEWLAPLRAAVANPNDDVAGYNVNVNNADAADDAGDKNTPAASNSSLKESLEKQVKTIDIKIKRKKVIEVGQTIPLIAVSKDNKGNIIYGIVPAWASSNPDIIKIGDDSIAVALKAGEASLKAGVGTVEREVTVKVELNKNNSQLNFAKNAAASSVSKNRKMMVVDVTPEEPVRPILADAELKQLVSPTNNLGSPMGQTEASSNTPSAAIAVSEHAGIGNFSFGLSVASLPGRGIDASVGLSYNSQLWTKSGYATNNQFTYNVDGNWLAPGFQIGYGYLDDYNAYGQLPYQLILTGIDGTRHQLTRTTAISGRAVYESSDGSFMRGDALYNSSNIVTDLTVTYTDGTKVAYGQPNIQSRRFPVKITDINGNFITINYLNNDQVGKISSVKDTLGRDMIFHYDATPEQKLISVTVPGYDGSATPRQTIRFYYETLTLQTAGRFDGTIVAPATESVLKYVYFPGTRTGYRYDYSADFGMIYKITQLQGMTISTADPEQMGTVMAAEVPYLESATTQYNYPGTGGTPLGSAASALPQYDKRIDDWIGRDASAPAPQTSYDKNEQIDTTTGVGTRTMSVTSPNGSINVSVSKVNPGVWDDGLTTEMSTTSPGRTLPWSKTILTWSPAATVSNGRRNPQLQKIVSINEVGQAKATTFTYDAYNNQTSVREFDFTASGEETSELRRTEITYETGANYIYNRLFNLPTSVKSIVGNAVVSRTDYKYDENPLTNRANIIQYDLGYNPNNSQQYSCNCRRVCEYDDYVAGDSGRCQPGSLHLVCDTCNTYDSNHNYRGNVTTVTSFVDPTNNTDPNASVTAFKYDIAGNTTEATLNCCNLKTWTYDATNNAYAYRIGETKGTDIQLTTSATFDFNTGLVKSATDENNQVTNYEYEPDTLRQKKVTYPNGAFTQTEFSDKLITASSQLSPGFVRTTSTLDTNKTAQSYSYYDGRGAGIRSAAQTPDGWSISAMTYDSIGRAKKSYNPFYGTTPIDAIPANVKWTEVTGYDGAGRTTQVKLQDDTLVNTFYNETAVSYTAPGNLTRTGTATRVQDQAGKERRQIVDSLGRVVRVDEPDTVSNTLGGVTAPNQPTHYFYDGNDNLSKVIQSDGGTTQERRFKYDALSRLTHEKQVEAIPTLSDAGVVGASDPNKWTKVLKYNTHGLVTDGIDARGVNTHISYDSLNRTQGITYSDGTPAVTYTYDQARAGFFNKGAVTKVQTLINPATTRPDMLATATEFDYDQMGRLKKQRQIIDSQTYNLEYGYNPAGQLTSETYPSGKIVNYGYDANGRLSSIADISRTYLNNLQYQGKGSSVSSISLGNGTTQTFSLNDRLQMNNQTLSKGSEILQKYDYGYGQIDASGNLDTTKNNGQLAKVESYIGANKQWTQKFNYDSVGRLSEAKEYRGDNNNLSYKQKFDFDRFGNLFRKNTSNPTAGQETPLAYTPIEETDISKSTNRFTTNTTYDDAGNVVTDDKFRAMSFAYDANGRMIKASKANAPDAISIYDAGGQRVAEKVNDVWKFSIYDVGGKVVAEYGGQQSNDEGGVKYLLTDWQGSTRAIVSNSGFVKARMDYTAFGEEIGAGAGQRTTAQGFGATSNLQDKYALTKRDEATGLDHTWFRKNENRAGRWTSPDPYNGSMSLGNPQSFNRYSYVENQPTNFIDPSGLDTWIVTVKDDYNPFLDDDWQRFLRDSMAFNRRAFDSSGGGGLGGGGGGGGGGDPVIPLDDPPPPIDPCDTFTAAIRKAYTEVVTRAIDLKQDFLDLVPRGIITKQNLLDYISNINDARDPERIRRQGSVEGHEQQFEDQQRGLNKNLKKYDDGNCNNKLPLKVREMAKLKTPSRTRALEQRASPINEWSSAIRNAAAGLGAATIIYWIVSESTRAIPVRNLIPIP